MKWTKPNGTVIKTNDTKETIAYCESLGWKVEKVKPVEEPKTDCPEPLAGEESVKPKGRLRGSSILRPGKIKKES